MWVVGSVAAVVGLVAVVVALLFDHPVHEESPTTALGPGLPRPAELRSLRFPTTWWGGYDHRAVDAELAELAERYEALYLAAGPRVLAEAERRLGGGSPDAPATADAPEADGPDRPAPPSGIS